MPVFRSGSTKSLADKPSMMATPPPANRLTPVRQPTPRPAPEPRRPKSNGDRVVGAKSIRNKELPAFSDSKSAVAPLSAALFCRRSKKRRRSVSSVENRAPLGVCELKMVELRGVEPLSEKAAAKVGYERSSKLIFHPGFDQKHGNSCAIRCSSY